MSITFHDAASGTIFFGSDSGGVALRLDTDGDRPVRLSIQGSFITPHPLVDILTAAEQRARTSQSYVRSAVGTRMRYVSDAEHAGLLEVLQHDPQTRLEVTSRIEAFGGALRIAHRIRNGGTEPTVLTAVTSAVLGLGSTEADLYNFDLLWGESEWLAEGRWHQQSLRDVVPRLDLALHAQDGRGRFSLTSHGAWSTGEFLPGGVLIERGSQRALAWQIESSGA